MLSNWYIKVGSLVSGWIVKIAILVFVDYALPVATNERLRGEHAKTETGS